MTAVAARSKAVAQMVEASARGRALMGGTQGMRRKSTTYLPKFTAESQETYDERLAMSWLFNGYKKAIRDMTGRVFRRPVELAEETPDDIAEWAKNIDLAGRDLSTFARDVFQDGLSAGIAYILVDAPARPEQVTRAAVASMGLRPYLSHIRVEDVLGWRTELVSNVTVLAQLRLMESVTEQDPKDEFKSVEIDQVRVLDRMEAGGVMTRLYRKREGGHGEYVLFAEPTISDMDDITLVPFYANRTGFFTGEPMLDDLADCNIAHWQSQSDQRNVLHFARVPILFGSGRQDDEPITISVGQMTTANDPAADLKWVEHSGKAIDAGRQDLKDLEFQMETLGLQLTVARVSSESATGAALDAEKETSQLSMTADSLQDALEQAMIYMLQYAGRDGVTPTVTVNKEFAAGMMSAQEMAVLLQAVQSGNMSRETFLRELARRGMVASDLNPQDEADRIASASPMIVGNPLGLEA